MSGTEDITVSQTILNFLISIITVVGTVVAVFRWKLRQELQSRTFKTDTSKELKSVLDKIESLCQKIAELEKRFAHEVATARTEHEGFERDLKKEVMASREEHIQFQSELRSMLKDLYKLMGKVDNMKKDDR